MDDDNTLLNRYCALHTYVCMDGWTLIIMNAR